MALLRTVAFALVAVIAAGCGQINVNMEAAPIRIISDKPGMGRAAKNGDVVTIHYRVLLPDGRQVLQQRDYQFELGAGTVIAGIDETVLGMRVRGERIVECPPHKHWGRDGYGNGAIPPNVYLTFEIQMEQID